MKSIHESIHPQKENDCSQFENVRSTCGHIHHLSRDKECAGCVVETFRTLAPKDAWHAGQGYRAGRDMYAITHHVSHGEFMRTRCDVSMLS